MSYAEPLILFPRIQYVLVRVAVILSFHEFWTAKLFAMRKHTKDI